MSISSCPLRFILASASPARRTTLVRAGLDPEVIVSGVDESSVAAASPAALAAELARLKAEAVADLLASSETRTDALIVGCDSLLEFDGVAQGKPSSPGEAAQRWRAMRGRSGVLHTGHHLIRTSEQPQAIRETASTMVHFADLSDAEIDAYVGTGEPLLVAGAFTIDGLGGPFVTRIEGDPHNVVGISLPLLRMMVSRLGIDWTRLWTPRDSPGPGCPGGPATPAQPK